MEDVMANIKSAKKRILTNEKKAARNQAIKSAVKTEIKKVRSAIEAGNKDEAAKALLSATSAIDKAESKGVFKKNTASRKVSRLAQAVNKL
jgi:small subunit ribosomal protein S20